MAPVSPSSRSVTPDTTFHLSSVERASVLPYYDADALERLLRMLPERARANTLASFQAAKPGESSGLLVQMGHPQLNAVLEEVWAPYWDNFSDEEMALQPRELPGRALGRERRAARSQTSPKR